MRVSLWILGGAVALGQTVAQSEASMAYLRKTACIVPDGAGGFDYDGGVPTLCRADVDCAAPATCEHESLVVPPASLYPPLEFPPAPTPNGVGEGILRYVPLCEDGSGDHEYSVSGGRLGRAPTCAPADFIRCGDGMRPRYRLDAGDGRSRDYLIHAGSGGHASIPYHYAPVWEMYNTLDAKAYTADEDPVTFGNFSGIYDEGAGNPLSDWNRVDIEKCTADGWTGNVDVEGLQDYRVEEVIAFQFSPRCRDADGDSLANCDDNLVDPAACDCVERVLAPPASPNQAYSVFYHGRRIVRAVVADLADGAVGYTTYPLRDDGTGQAQVRRGDEALPRPAASSTLAFSCHSAGCTALEGGLIDDLHDWIDTIANADIDVRAVFNSFGNPAVEAEACVSEYDGVDVRAPRGEADNPGIIDDTCSIYDQTVDAVAITGESMSYDNYGVGGFITEGLLDYWDPTRAGYAEPVDASCLDHHCPGAVDWSLDPRCTPCNSPLHVLFNHLDTPFVYNEALRDGNQVDTASAYCDYTSVDLTPCDHNGDLTGVDLTDTHWRQLVRKQFADAFRYGETDRCEGGPGREWPYNHVLLLLPDRSSHESLLQDATANLPLNPAGPVPTHTLGEATWKFLELTTPATPVKAMCLQEAFQGENAADFTAGGVAGCQ